MRESGKKSFLSHTALMAGASVISQGINFLGMLLLARLYSPVEIGVFGLFNAVLSFTAIASSWRYELSIVTCDDDTEAADIALFVVLNAILFAVLIGALLLVLDATLPALLSSAEFRSALSALPLALILAGTMAAGLNLCLREQRFGRIAVQQITVSTATVLSQALLVDSDKFGGGLLFGFLLGQVGALCVYGPLLVPVVVGRIRMTKLMARLRTVAYAHRGHFYYTNPYTLVGQLYFQAPVLLLGTFFGAHVAGLYAMAYRTTSAPLGLVPLALAQVLFPELARDKARHREWEVKLSQMFVGLGVIMAPAVALILAWGPDLFALILGGRWHDAGLISQIIVIPILMMALASGYDRLYFVLNQQRAALLVIGAASLVSFCLMFLLGRANYESWIVVAAWAVTHGAFSIAWMATIYRISDYSLTRLMAGWALVGLAIAAIALVMFQWPLIVQGELWRCLVSLGGAGIYAWIAWRQVPDLLGQLLRNPGAART